MDFSQVSGLSPLWQQSLLCGHNFLLVELPLQLYFMAYYTGG